ncbi:MAG: RidA family protein [Chloroflexi bacterium]|nr:RidA family protein [Chloroflexota bacterium]
MFERDTSSPEDRIRRLGLTLPPPWKDDVTRVRALESRGYVFMSGHGPLGPDSVPLVTGKLGRELTVEQGYEAAKLTAYTMLGTLKGSVGSLNRVARVVKVLGFVNCAPGFNTPSLVINGFSDVIVDVFGPIGRHTRSAIGVAELYADIPVEIEAIFELVS